MPKNALDHARTEKKIVSLARCGDPVEVSMAALVDWCEARAPHPAWKKVRRVGWAADVKRMRRWLTALLRDEPPPPEVDGIGFGLCVLVDDETDEPVADLYACGNRYDPDDSDWPAGPRWFPEERFAVSTALAKVYGIAHAGGDDDELGSDIEESLVLGYAAFAVAELCRSIDPALVRGACERRRIATGYDGGGLLELGAVGPRGFVLRPRSYG